MYDFLVSSLSGNILIRSFIHSLLIRKQVDFEGEGKVLLTRLGDQIHATSAFCTHYGAPLVKGVLTADGRVVWYVIPSFPPPVVLVVLVDASYISDLSWISLSLVRGMEVWFLCVVR